MKKMTIIFSVIFLAYSCGCSDEGTDYVNFNEFESSIIPTNINSQVEFENQNSEIITAEYTEFDNEPIYSTPSEPSCHVYIFESRSVILSITELELNFRLNIKVLDYGNRREVIFIIQTDEEMYFINGSVFDESEDIEQFLTNYNSNGFEFNDVFIFSGSIENEISKIIYEPQVGVRLIEFNDSTYLKLIE